MVTINMIDASAWLNIFVNFISIGYYTHSWHCMFEYTRIYCHKSFLLLLLLWQNSNCESVLVPWLFSYHPSHLCSVESARNIFFSSNSPLMTRVLMCSNQGQQQYLVLRHHNSIQNNVHITRTKYYERFETQNNLTVRDLTLYLQFFTLMEGRGYIW